MSKEYTYDIGEYTIGVDENGNDNIGLTVAMIENNEIKFLGSCYGDNARCIDLLIRENQELKKQLERKYEKVGTLTGELLYEENTKLINQQKEFIEYLENMLDNENDIFSVVRVKDVLSKYKEIIGNNEQD